MQQVFKSGFDSSEFPPLFFYLILIYVNCLSWFSAEWIFFCILCFFMLIWISRLSDLQKIALDEKTLKYGPRLTWYFLPVKNYKVNLNYEDILQAELQLPKKTLKRQLLLTTKNYKNYSIPERNFLNFDALVQTVEQYVNIKNLSNEKERLKKIYFVKSNVKINNISYVLASVGFILIHFCSYWHFNVISIFVICAFICFLLVVVISFIISNKKNVRGFFRTLSLSALCLGLSLAFLITSTNQIYTEYLGEVHSYGFQFVKQQGHLQTWHTPLEMNLKEGDFVINNRWKPGFTEGFKPGNTYQISIKKGLLNDWAFAPDAFRNAREVNTKLSLVK